MVCALPYVTMWENQTRQGCFVCFYTTDTTDLFFIDYFYLQEADTDS